MRTYTQELKQGVAVTLGFYNKNTIESEFNSSDFNGVFFGGGEGSRTPVRKHIHRNFSGRRRILGFPQLQVIRRTLSLGSFMMRGTLKALRTHGRH